MQTQAQRTRDLYMQRARIAQKAREDYLDGKREYLPAYHPVEYYVMQARRANRQVVFDKLWSKQR